MRSGRVGGMVHACVAMHKCMDETSFGASNRGGSFNNGTNSGDSEHGHASVNHGTRFTFIRYPRVANRFVRRKKLVLQREVEKISHHVAAITQAVSQYGVAKYQLSAVVLGSVEQIAKRQM